MPEILDRGKLHINESGGKNYPEPDIPVEDAWNNMKELLQQAPAPASQSGSATGKGILGKTKVMVKLFAATGSIAIVASIIYFVAGKKAQPASAQIVYSSDNTPKSDTLPDGAIAYLDMHSSLAVTSENGEEKQLTLHSGGCYFKQINNTASPAPWQIQAGPVTVYPNNASLYISVDSVSSVTTVQVQNGHAEIQRGNEKLNVAAGESVKINTQQHHALTKQKLNPNLYSYANKVFEFSNTSFNEAAAFLEKAYGVTFIIKNNKLDNCTVTTRFDNKSLEEILDILGYTLAFEYEIDKNKNQVIISADGCN